MAFVQLTSQSSVVAAALMRPNIATRMCRSKLYCVVCSRDAVSNPVMCIIYVRTRRVELHCHSHGLHSTLDALRVQGPNNSLCKFILGFAVLVIVSRISHQFCPYLPFCECSGASVQPPLSLSRFRLQLCFLRRRSRRLASLVRPRFLTSSYYYFFVVTSKPTLALPLLT